MEIADIKARLSIQTVLQHYNLKPDRNNMLRCPFHADDVASMKIYPQTNTFNCFGCGKNGDQIEFCTLKEGNKHKGLLKATELTGDIKPTNGKPKEVKSHPKENHTEILTRVFTYFQNGLNSGVARKPKEYLESRGLSPSGETACPDRNVSGGKGLEIGYNSGQFHHRGQLSETDKQACAEAGLLIPYKGHNPNTTAETYTPFAKDCIIFPLKDKSGNITSLYGRSITSTDARSCVSNGKPLLVGICNPDLINIGFAIRSCN